MPSRDEVVITRPLNDVGREVRIIRALYPTQCLAIAVSPIPTPNYHNTGIQTLPPANGNVFRLVHGREPSQDDYTCNMGSAAIGRLTNDPRSNPYDLIYGLGYPIPTAAITTTYEDSGFQTAKHDTRRKTLARAKVRASMTAKKYRNAAFQAGYIISAESRDDMIVHLEQFLNNVQLDAVGNLLEGTVKTRSLPNIYGTLIQSKSFMRMTPLDASELDARCLPSDGYHGSRISPAHSSALQSSLAISNLTTEVLQKPAAGISALAPSSTDQETIVEPIFDDEYGSGEPGIHEYIVYDASTEQSRAKPAHGDPNVSVGKEISTEDTRSISVAPEVFSPPSQPDQGRITLPMDQESKPRSHPRSPNMFRSRVGDFDQERTSNVAQVSFKPYVKGTSIASSPAATLKLREQKSQSKTPLGPLLGTIVLDPSSEDYRSLGGKKQISGRQLPSASELPRSYGNSATCFAVAAVDDPSVKPLSPVKRHLKSKNEQASLQLEQSLEETSVDPLEDEPEVKRPQKRSSGDVKDKSSFEETNNAREDRDSSSSDLTVAPCRPRDTAVGKFVSTRMEKKSKLSVSRVRRQPIVPYLPPAKRAKSGKNLRTEKEKSD